MLPDNPRLRWLRQHFNANGAEVKSFADRVGINRSMMSPLLSGDRPISDRTVYRVANRLGVAPPEGMDPIATERNEGPKEAQAPAPAQTDQLARLTRAVEEQGVLLRTLTELIIARLGKDALKG